MAVIKRINALEVVLSLISLHTHPSQLAKPVGSGRGLTQRKSSTALWITYVTVISILLFCPALQRLEYKQVNQILFTL